MTEGIPAVDVTVDDVKDLALELWLTQRENTRLRRANSALVAQLEELRPPEPEQSQPGSSPESNTVLPQPEGSPPCQCLQETCPRLPPPPPV